MKSPPVKTVLITGGSRGIGRAIAHKLAEGNVCIVISYLNSRAKADETVKQIHKCGAKAVAIQADITKLGDVRRLFKKASEVSGNNKLDIVINSAGVTHVAHKPIKNTSEELYDKIFDVNTKGVFLCLREAIPYLKINGRIINFSSSGVVTPHPGHAVFTAAKSAVEVFTRTLSKELEGCNITVNCIAPGAIATEDWLQGKTEKLKRKVAHISPLHRLGTPEDIAEAVAFLVSPQAEWINGQIIRANGGFI